MEDISRRGILKMGLSAAYYLSAASVGAVTGGIISGELKKHEKDDLKSEVESAFQEFTNYKGTDNRTRRNLLAKLSKVARSSHLPENIDKIGLGINSFLNGKLLKLKYERDQSNIGKCKIETVPASISKNPITIKPSEQEAVIRTNHLEGGQLLFFADVLEKPILIPKGPMELNVSRHRWISIRENEAAGGINISYTARGEEQDVRFMRSGRTDSTGLPVVDYRFEIGRFSEIQSTEASWHSIYAADGSLIETYSLGNSEVGYDPKALFEDMEATYNDALANPYPRFEKV